MRLSWRPEPPLGAGGRRTAPPGDPESAPPLRSVLILFSSPFTMKTRLSLLLATLVAWSLTALRAETPTSTSATATTVTVVEIGSPDARSKASAEQRAPLNRAHRLRTRPRHPPHRQRPWPLRHRRPTRPCRRPRRPLRFLQFPRSRPSPPSKPPRRSRRRRRLRRPRDGRRATRTRRSSWRSIAMSPSLPASTGPR